VLVLCTAILAVVLVWGFRQIVAEQRATREEAARSRMVQLLGLFAQGLHAVEADPRALLTWHPLARTARSMFPAEFETLERAAGAPFPFPAGCVQAAHAQWTTEWLAWERAHDAEYKLKAAALEQELAAPAPSSLARARLDSVEREKLDLYQRRYAEYIRVSKALQGLMA
jgi:hypothetical protein